MTAIAQSYFMTQRDLRFMLRQPWFILITLIQPIIWLVLFGSLFRSVTEIPGFAGGGSYLDFLVPAIVIMTALFASGWSGMGTIEDIDRGVMDRVLTAPLHRSSIIVGRVVYQSVSLVVQAAIMCALAWLLGAQFASGLVGVALVILCGMLLAAAFAAFSNATALLLRQRESVIGANTLLVLPLTFLSAAFMPLALVPDWIAAIARWNPVNWAVEAGRASLLANPDWALILPRLGGLLAVAVACMALATLAFRSYQRSA
jgi:ABC-2 type transport system permease protein